MVDYSETRPPDTSLGIQILKTLVEHTIDDVTRDQMNTIVRRLSRMSRSDINSPVRVGQVLSDELGEAKALSYIDKALANGMIKFADYEKIRAAILLRMKRTEIPQARAVLGMRELTEGQKRIQEDLGKIRDLGMKTLEKPFSDLNKDIERIRRAWGV